VQVACRSGGVRQGSEAIFRSGVAVAGKGAFHVLQQLQTLLPSLLRSSAQDRDDGSGGPPVPFL
jgi:hypothetical protein